MLTKDVEILVLRNGEKKKTHENDSPTVTKVNIQEFKTRATMYWNQHMGEARNHVQKTD